MATLSAISKFLACYTWDRNRGVGAGVWVRYHKLGQYCAFFFFCQYLLGMV